MSKIQSLTAAQRKTVLAFQAADADAERKQGDRKDLARKVYLIDPSVSFPKKGTPEAHMIVKGEKFALTVSGSTTVATTVSRWRAEDQRAAMTPAERKRADADAERNKANKAAKAKQDAHAEAVQSLTLSDAVARIVPNMMQVSDADFRTLVLGVAARQKREREAAAKATAANGK